MTAPTLAQPPAPVVIIRCSSMPTAADCMRRWAAHNLTVEIDAAGYQLTEPTKSIAAPMGTALHAGAELMLREKAATGALPPPSVSADATIDTLRDEISGGVVYESKGPTQNRDVAEKQLLRMHAVYRDHLAPKIDPVLIETRLEAEVAPGFVLSGKLDVLAREKRKLRDLKSGKKLGNYHLQQGSYGLVLEANGEDVQAASIDFVKRCALRAPQDLPVENAINVAVIKNAAWHQLRLIQAATKIWREGDPEHDILPGDPYAFPSNPSSVLCSKRWCRAHGTEFCRDAVYESEEE